MAENARAGAPGTFVATPGTAEGGGPLIDFDIPSRPLAEALNEYAGVTGRPAVYPSALVDGRRSAPVKGAYRPEEALRALLADTGLTVDEIGAERTRVFVLKPVPEGRSALAGGPAQAESLDPPSYDGLVQSTVWRALCDNPQTTPGDYRALIRFRVDTTGQLWQARLLDSTGEIGRDRALLQTLEHVRIRRNPPFGLIQPLTLLILPRGEIKGRPCGEALAP